MLRLDCLVSGTTTNGAVTLVSLQNGNSFNSPLAGILDSGDEESDEDE